MKDHNIQEALDSIEKKLHYAKAVQIRKRQFRAECSTCGFKGFMHGWRKIAENDAETHKKRSMTNFENTAAVHTKYMKTNWS
jgi:hypothetical protein